MNTKSAAITIIVLIVLVALAYLAFGHSKPAMPVAPGAATTTEQSANPTDTSAPAATPAASTGTTNTTATKTTTGHAPVTVTYGPDGFSPKSVTIPVGTTVTWVNQGGGRMWVASASHPTHTVYDGTSTAQHCAANAPTSGTVFDQCTAGSSFTFTFTKAGTWNYHNHANASHFGTVVVTP